MTAVLDGPTSIRVSWTPSSDATGYRIHYISVSDSGNETVSDGSTETHTLTGLVNGETYTISVVATSDNLPSESVTADIAVGLRKCFSKFCVECRRLYMRCGGTYLQHAVDISVIVCQPETVKQSS